MSTPISTYQIRLRSFRPTNKPMKITKWPPNAPSTQAMARSFLSRLPGRTDVRCTVCHLVLTNFNEHEQNPMEKHIGLNSFCFVAKLGELCEQLRLNQTLTPSELKELVDTCKQTLPECEHLGDLGFFSLPYSLKNMETVGCISCMCYPQEFETPQHDTKCLIDKLIKTNGIKNTDEDLSAQSSNLEGLETSELHEPKANKPTNEMPITPNQSVNMHKFHAQTSLVQSPNDPTQTGGGRLPSTIAFQEAAQKFCSFNPPVTGQPPSPRFQEFYELVKAFPLSKSEAQLPEIVALYAQLYDTVYNEARTDLQFRLQNIGDAHV